MAADISGIIADFTGADWSDDFPGLQLPTLTNGSFSRGLPDGCKGCPNALTTHKSWTKLRMGSSAKPKLWMGELDDEAEAIRDKVDLIRSLIQLLNLQAHGVLNLPLMTIGGSPVSQGYNWPLVSAGAGFVRARYDAGTPDPRAVVRTVATISAGWGDGTGGGKYTTDTRSAGLPPRGIVTLTAPSELQAHNGWICYQIRPASGEWDAFGVGDEFDLKIFGSPNNSLATTKWPVADPGDISAHYQVYMTNDEPWVENRHSFPMFAKPKSATFASVTNIILTLEASARIRPPTTAYLTATHTKGGVPADVTAFVIAHTIIENNAGAYKTTIDLTSDAVTYDGTGTLVVDYFIESADNAAIMCGQDRCSNSVQDLTSSFGESGGAESGSWYCQFRKDRGDGVVATKAAVYIPACTETGCSHWVHNDTGTNPVSQGVMQQITHDFPYLLRQAFAGINQFELLRLGTPSLATLAGLNVRIPGGFHLIQLINAYQVEQWARVAQIESLWAKMLGFEFLTFSATGQLPDLSDSATWPSYGPAGDNFARDAEMPLTVVDDLAKDSNDPQRTQRAQIMKRTLTLNCYTGTKAGEHGKYQNLSSIHPYVLFFPQIDAGNRATTQFFTDGSIEPGYWTADLTSQGAEDVDTVYYWRLLMTRGRRYDRENYNDYGGAVLAGKIAAVETITGGFRFYFELGTEYASTQILPQIERSTIWKAGGNIVDPPEWAKVFNYQSTGRRGVSASKARNGMAARFTVADGFSLPLAVAGDDRTERRFPVTKAEAHRDDAHKGTFSPSSGEQTETFADIQFGRIFFPFEKAGETVQSAEVKRDLAVLDDQLVTLTYFGDGDTKPYGMDKDMYWHEPYEDAELGLYGLFIYFSVLNGTGLLDPFSSFVTMYITTDNKTYDPLTVDIVGDENGWDAKVPVVFTARATITGIQSVVVERRDGTVDVCTSYGGSPPAEWEGWALNKYYAVIDGTELDISVSPDYSSDTLRVELATDDYSGGDYYNDNVAFHGNWDGWGGGSLPPGYAQFGNRYDAVEIRDEGGLLAAWAAANGGTAGFIGKTIRFRTDLVMHWLNFAIGKNTFGTDQGDSGLSASDYLALQANGEIFLKDVLTDQEEAAKECIIITGRVADRNKLPRSLELQSLVTTLERMISE